jgi:hypothetical protein
MSQPAPDLEVVAELAALHAPILPQVDEVIARRKRNRNDAWPRRDPAIE